MQAYVGLGRDVREGYVGGGGEGDAGLVVGRGEDDGAVGSGCFGGGRGEEPAARG